MAAYQTARRDLLAERTADGHWIGELSSSALSTATATSALALVARHDQGGCLSEETAGRLLGGGLRWLAGSQNSDGGWGDTDKSYSNLATTMLVRAAFHLAGQADAHPTLLRRAEEYLTAHGDLAGLRRRYGKDKTFVVPILTNCALAGLVPWEQVVPLPFEIACLPGRLLGALQLPVVSYAIPALVAIGQARYLHLPPWGPMRWLRRAAVTRSLDVLERMQPASGGFLEAAPLTSFVVMSLAGTGRVDHPVVRRGVEFLVRSVRGDGSWPIDTNLATWLTSLSIGALADGDEGELPQCLDWLLSCQHHQVHPMTRAAPGGWGWTDLSGAVPDADDTPGALLALATLRLKVPAGDVGQLQEIDAAAVRGIRWLLGLQNADGGWPTFCRGWTNLPFDRSGTDLTAHAIRALHAWSTTEDRRAMAAVERGLRYLARQQRSDGSWLPLWFGNQDHPEEENPVYGTGKVLLAYRDLGLGHLPQVEQGLSWLVSQMLPEGGWGCPKSECPAGRSVRASVEETAVAVEALVWCASDSLIQGVVGQGVRWLVEAVETGRHQESSPIGFYFAKLWYYERLYPMILSVSALSRAARIQSKSNS